MQEIPAAAREAIEGLAPFARAHIAAGEKLVAALQTHARAAPESAASRSAAAGVARELDELLHSHRSLLREGARRGLSEQGVALAIVRSDPRGPDALPKGLLALSLERVLSAAQTTAWSDAAKGRNPDAEFVVATLAEDVAGTPLELALLERAADAGHAPAATELAVRWANAASEEQVRRSVERLRPVATAEWPHACAVLAHLRLMLAAEESEFAEVRRLLRVAAEAGDADATLDLAGLTARRAADEPDAFPEALRWMKRAGAAGSELARQWLDEYGHLRPAEYGSVVWAQQFLPERLPPPPSSSLPAKLVCGAVLALVVAASFAGNSLGLFLLVVFVSVLAHEWGHMAVGRRLGAPTIVFNVGVGPVVWSWERRGAGLPMLVVLRLLPLLGSVRPYTLPRDVWRYWRDRVAARSRRARPPPVPAFDREAEPRPAPDHLPWTQRLAFEFGGLGMNVALAIVALALYVAGSPLVGTVVAPVLGEVADGSVAGESGFRAGDRVLAIDGKTVHEFRDVREGLGEQAGEVSVRRAGEVVTLGWLGADTAQGSGKPAPTGLGPALSWVVGDVADDRMQLKRGDRIIGWDDGDGYVSADDPEARERLRTTFATAGERLVRGIVERLRDPDTRSDEYPRGSDAVQIRVVRDGGTQLDLGVRPGHGRGAECPFSFALLREDGPRHPFPARVGDLFAGAAIGLVNLPGTIGAALLAPPSREDRGRVLAAVGQDGWRVFHLLAWVNAFLFFLNLVPVPPLDGFRVAVTLIEAARGRPLPRRALDLVLRAGWVVLLAWVAVNALLLLRDLGATFL